MKYLLLDTNIYIDMVVYRNKENPPKSYECLRNLLEFNQIKLVVPKIVKDEVYRHIEDEINKVGDNLKNLKNKINNIYWVSRGDEVSKFKDKINNLSNNISEVKIYFDKNKESYIQEFKEKIATIFGNDNSILIEETQDLILGVEKRKIYKRCPFHIKNKESSADALIVEILVNLNKFINFIEDDKVIFITKNFIDFSKSKSKEEREIIHPDICDSLKENMLYDKFIYSIFYYKTLKEHFKEELEVAEELETVIEEQVKEEEEERKRHLEYIIDLDREECGLSELYSDYNVMEYINEDTKFEELKGILNKYNEFRDKVENYIIKYDELIDYLQNLKKVDLKECVKRFNKKSAFITIDMDGEEIIDNMVEFIDNYIVDINLVNLINQSKYEIKEEFQLETIVDIYDYENNRILLNAEGYLSPSNFGQDYIELKILKNGILVKRGIIDISYGGAELNDDGGIGDAQEGYIEYYIDGIQEYFDNIIDKGITKISEKQNLLDKLIKLLEINLD
ncbi:PIN domain-containing protein [Clostridium novyi]|uniref:Conserved protein n=1 Tax=Clostridium novyi (strain NT) TaxID=386415 RepID=A0PZJ7_CLONN|nr:PIN domain-containing protein [Clostridium novyi]ABK60364.1 conserved protein [Clostridium novyi NT]KEH84979.1 hypothetical protein Z966_09195 [Clostridium novyi A str. NCTC 538]